MTDRELLADLHAAALRAVHAGDAVERSLRERDPGGDRLVVLAAGKAACAMARGARTALGSRVARGRVVTRDGHAFAVPPLEVAEAAHPLPDERGVRESGCALRLAESLGPDESLLVLLSGGASALWCAPAPGVTLEDKFRVSDALMRAGADIAELNTVRKHLSAIKGGGLARAAQRSSVLTLAVSDVAGDRPDRIGSGPTAPDPTSYTDALEVLRARGVLERAPARVVLHLERGRSGEIEETWKPDAQGTDALEYRVVAGLDDALAAASDRARELGQKPRLLGATLYGEARSLAGELAAAARELGALGGGLLIAGGEPTVSVRGPGIGGRCQELALAFALELGDEPGVTALFAGTDGSDGPTDAAGSFADAGTPGRAAARGLDAAGALLRNDSHPLLAATGDLYRTGPTETNVTDLGLIRVRAK